MSACRACSHCRAGRRRSCRHGHLPITTRQFLFFVEISLRLGARLAFLPAMRKPGLLAFSSTSRHAHSSRLTLSRLVKRTYRRLMVRLIAAEALVIWRHFADAARRFLLSKRRMVKFSPKAIINAATPRGHDIFFREFKVPAKKFYRPAASILLSFECLPCDAISIIDGLCCRCWRQAFPSLGRSSGDSLPLTQGLLPIFALFLSRDFIFIVESSASSFTLIWLIIRLTVMSI